MYKEFLQITIYVAFWQIRFGIRAIRINYVLFRNPVK